MENKTGKSGRAAILIVHALAWAAAILIGSYAFKERPFGEDFFLWMVVGFNLSNGLLIAAVARQSRC
jgi:hypothetical protein